MKAKVIGITGLASAGKDTSAQHIINEYSYEWLNFSDILVEEAEERGIEPTKMNLSEIGDEYREEYGMGGLAKGILEKMKKADSNKFVITGFRSPEEVDYIRNHVEDFILVEISTDRELRWKRRKQEDPADKDDFFERDRRDKESKGLGKVIEMADEVVENNSSFEDLYEQLDKIVVTF